MKKKAMLYLAIAFGWTWFCWGAGYFLSMRAGYNLNTEANLFATLVEFVKGKGKLAELFFVLAVFGPVLGYIAVAKKSKEDFYIKQSKMLWAALVVPFVVTLPTLLLSMMFLPLAGRDILVLFNVIAGYWVSNFFTSGTEEFGWRGFLYGYLKTTEKTFWDISWKGGIIWAAWHYPLLLILYKGLSLVALLPMMVGFTAGIVAMNYITNIVFEKTKSIPVVMFMHALNNTLSFVVMLLYPTTPYIILVHVMSWVVVGILEKRVVNPKGTR